MTTTKKAGNEINLALANIATLPNTTDSEQSQGKDINAIIEQINNNTEHQPQQRKTITIPVATEGQSILNKRTSKINKGKIDPGFQLQPPKRNAPRKPRTAFPQNKKLADKNSPKLFKAETSPKPQTSETVVQSMFKTPEKVQILSNPPQTEIAEQPIAETSDIKYAKKTNRKLYLSDLLENTESELDYPDTEPIIKPTSNPNVNKANLSDFDSNQSIEQHNEKTMNNDNEETLNCSYSSIDSSVNDNHTDIEHEAVTFLTEYYAG